MSNSNQVTMIPDLQSSLLCDDVRQEGNGKFMLIGIFDGLAVGKLPAAFMKICIVNRWCCGTGVFKQATRILAPDGQTVALQGKEVEIKLTSDIQTATSVEVFVNAHFQEAETYWVEIMMDGQMRMRYPLVIKLVQKQQIVNS